MSIAPLATLRFPAPELISWFTTWICIGRLSAVHAIHLVNLLMCSGAGYLSVATIHMWASGMLTLLVRVQPPRASDGIEHLIDAHANGALGWLFPDE